MRRITILVSALMCAVCLMAQNHSFQTGLRVGVGQHIDVNYGYFVPEIGDVELGFRTGVSFGYAHKRNKIGISEHFAYRPTDQDGVPYDLRYEVTGTAVCKQQQLMLELPVMFALRWRGLYTNVGARLATPMVYNRWSQDIDDLVIRVTDVKVNNTIANTQTNSVIGKYYGQASEAQLHQAGPETATWLKFIAAAEIGYEWKLGNYNNYDVTHYLGVGVYVDYAFYSVGEKLHEVADPTRDVVQISQVTVDKAASVSIARACNSSSLAQWPDFGIRVHYGLLADATTVNGRRSGGRYRSRSFYSPGRGRW